MPAIAFSEGGCLNGRGIASTLQRTMEEPDEVRQRNDQCPELSRMGGWNFPLIVNAPVPLFTESRLTPKL